MGKRKPAVEGEDAEKAVWHFELVWAGPRSWDVHQSGPLICLPLADSFSKSVQRCTRRENMARPRAAACSWITERHSSEKQSEQEQREVHQYPGGQGLLFPTLLGASPCLYHRAPCPSSKTGVVIFPLSKGSRKAK